MIRDDLRMTKAGAAAPGKLLVSASRDKSCYACAHAMCMLDFHVGTINFVGLFVYFVMFIIIQSFYKPYFVQF